MNRFEQPDSAKKPESIRNEIDQTRQQMNHTIDALTERLKGRHLLDELLGLFRSNGNGNGRDMHEMKEKISQSASSAVHSVVETVKAHPLPIIAIGAGIAWLMYERREREYDRSYDYGREPDDLAYPSGLTYPSESEAGAGETFAYTSLGAEETVGPGGYEEMDMGQETSAAGAMDRVREKAGEIKRRVRNKADEIQDRLRSRKGDMQGRMGSRTSELKQRAREGMERWRERAGDASSQLRQRTSAAADRTRARVAETSREHPLETGLACLAIGLLAGMLTPTPRKVEDRIAPAGTRMRERVRETGSDLADRGKQVVQAATDAAKSEARSQGLTPDAMRERLHDATASDSRSQASAGPATAAAMPSSDTGPAIADQPDAPESFRRPSAPPANPAPPTV